MVLPALGHSKTSWELDVDYVLVLDHIFILARSLDNCEDISLISSDIYFYNCCVTIQIISSEPTDLKGSFSPCHLFSKNVFPISTMYRLTFPDVSSQRSMLMCRRWHSASVVPIPCHPVIRNTKQTQEMIYRRVYCLL